VAPIVHSIEISRNPDDVFAYLTDLSRFTEWQDAVVSARPLEDGPMRVGSKATMTRRMGKREQTMTTELTEWSPPRSYAFHGIDGPIRAIGKGTLEPVGDGQRTRFTFALDFEGHGIGKVLIPLVVRRQARTEMTKSHEALKERLESSSA
jgi:ribosome-associated toxin RatA of RatAB toxin-antitoxin module